MVPPQVFDNQEDERMPAVAVEIAVQDTAGVRIALRAGADRIELCAALGVGGLTPSIGQIDAAVAAAEAAGREDFVHVLVRPRAGGFVYDADDIAVTVRDIRAARRAGAGGVVVGALTATGAVHEEATRAFVDAAGGLQVTFHRAFDAVTDPFGALETLAALRITRVLTSGQAARSIDGVDVLRRLAAVATGRIQVMAGGGVRVDDIASLREAGVDAVHLSARRPADRVTDSGPGGGEAAFDVTDADVVNTAVASARR